MSIRLAAAIAACCCSLALSAQTARATGIHVLSNRADLISGGDALVEITTPSGTTDDLAVTLNGVPITPRFALRPNGRIWGLVTGLQQGRNTLVAGTPGDKAKITITNYPIGGPIFSGPQIQPWPCLSGAEDAQCNRPTTYHYRYKPISDLVTSSIAGQTMSGFKDYDPNNPPNDVATTTTDSGMTVPYIIRVEHGNQDRAEYRVAVLFDPKQDWQPWAPQRTWNGKTYVTGGSGCGTHHGESLAPDVEVDEALKRGFMVWSTALDHNTQNCNLVVQAESLMMAKEHIIEAYGPIRYTIGSGCSGGSIYQQQAANDYPGIFDGILPNCSFPDSWSTAVEVVDCRLLVDYFDAPGKWGAGIAWAPQQQAAVEGHPAPNICQAWINLYGFDQGGNPRLETGSLDTQDCNVPPAAANDPNSAYDPVVNPGGVRCDLADYFVNELGRRPQDGFANRPSDNVGVQYGLKALQAGTITAAQFIDLNQKLGGRDIDYNPVANRVAADAPAIPIAYRGGLFNEGNNMSLPIIDLRGHDIEEIHHDYRSYVMRARLDRANGQHANQVIWTGPIPLVGDPSFTASALTVMDSWLAAIEADHSALPLAQKVIVNKPAAAHDLCTDGLGNEIPSQSLCAALYPFFAEPRIAAGEPFTGDILKCQLRPIALGDYAAAFPAVTDDQFLQLQTVFPNGVCDYGQPGIGQQPTIPWLSYANGPGGQALGPPPISEKF